MKLKLVVASMSMLGLIASPAFAAGTQAQPSAYKASMQKGTQNNMQRSMRQRTMSDDMQMTHVDYKDYKGTAMCSLSPNTITMYEMTQNTGRSIPSKCLPGWYNRIAMSGGVNIDAGKWGNRGGNFMGENYQRLSLNDAYFNITANVNDWINVFTSLSFSNPTTNANPAVVGILGAAEYNAAYTNNINGNANNIIQLEQAIATFGNLDESMFFFQAGKEFQDFSRYEIHPITESMTQVMSKILTTSLRAGFIADGFHGTLSVFDDPINKTGSNTRPTNYVAALGYDQRNEQFGWDLGAAYLYNLIGVNDVAYNVVNFNTFGGTTGTTGGYNSRVGAYALYGDINDGPFSVGARFTSAHQTFNAADLPKNGAADVTGATITGGSIIAGSVGARPWAAGFQANYNFDWFFDKNQNLYAGYQASHQAGGLNLPSSRWLVGYNIDMWKNTNLAAEWDRDIGFLQTEGGNGKTTNLFSLRAAVQFA